MELPSKELLSEVLGVKITDVMLNDNTIQYRENMPQFGRYSTVYTYINIYELLHEFKEWAYNLENDAMQVQVYRTPTSFVCEVYSKDHPIRRFKTNAAIEIDAVKKACEWIYNEIKDK